MSAPIDVDVVVVGSGGAGLSAALSASLSGARVVVLEKAPHVGGTTSFSGAFMWLPGNSFSSELGYDDSPALVEQYLQHVTLGTVDADLLRGFVREAPRAFRFLCDHTHFDLEGSRTPDYQSEYAGALPGRQVAMGLYDSKRLGEQRSLIRPRPLACSPSVRNSESLDGGLGIGQGSAHWYEVGLERERDGWLGRGQALVGGLLEGGLEHGVEIVTDARVLDLEVRANAVVGVEVQVGDRTVAYRARQGVVLASGGFEWNDVLWRKLVGIPLPTPLSPPYATGDGLRMAAKAGALLGNLNQAWWLPSLVIPGEQIDGRQRARTGFVRAGLPGAIAVNRSGRRFGNESMNYNDYGLLMARMDPERYEFPNLPAWVVFGSEEGDAYPLLSHDRVTTPDPSWLHESDTLAGLAEKIGVDPDGLVDEVREFDRHAEGGTDPVFHRGEGAWERYAADPTRPNPCLGPVGRGPYFAYEMKLGVFGTKGGPVIDELARVVDFSGAPIPGLFAAGNVTASVFGAAYPGGGSTLGPAVTFGYVAGRAATTGS